MTVIDIFLVILTNFIMGSSYAVGGAGMKCFAPIFLYSLRFLISGSVSTIFNKFPAKEDIKNILLLSFFTIITFTGLALGVKHLDSSTSSILIRLDVAWAIILSFFILKEKISLKTIFSVILSMIGLFIIKSGISFNNLKYFFIVIIASIADAMTTIMTKKIKNTSNKQIIAWNSLFTGIGLLIISLLLEKPLILKTIDFKAIFVVLYFALFSTYISYYIFYYLLRKYSPSKITPYNFSRIIVSLLAGYIMLGEDITLRKIIGAMLILAGMFLSQFKKKEK